MGSFGSSRREDFKKKDLTDNSPRSSTAASDSIREKGQTVRERKSKFLEDAQLLVDATELDEAQDDFSTQELKDDWDAAVRYHEFREKWKGKRVFEEIQNQAVQGIYRKAKSVLGAVIHPRTKNITPWNMNVQVGDLALEETLEERPEFASTQLRKQAQTEDILIEHDLPIHQPVVLCVDTSLSMTGEKLALTAVALAVVILQFPDAPLGVVAFENEAFTLKRPEEKVSPQEFIRRFLKVPAEGYTHLEKGLRAAFEMSQSMQKKSFSTTGITRRKIATILVSDGKYTAGRDPSYLAAAFDSLSVLKMGDESASKGLCQELARRGKGLVSEVGHLESLPTAMYGLIKNLLRGRAIAVK